MLNKKAGAWRVTLSLNLKVTLSEKQLLEIAAIAKEMGIDDAQTEKRRDLFTAAYVQWKMSQKKDD
jgi:hypothetical protein